MIWMACNHSPWRLSAFLGDVFTVQNANNTTSINLARDQHAAKNWGNKSTNIHVSDSQTDVYHQTQEFLNSLDLPQILRSIESKKIQPCFGGINHPQNHHR
jgi:hypothetical protein